VEARHHELLVPALRDQKEAVVPVLVAELGKRALPDWTAGRAWVVLYAALPAVVGLAAAVPASTPDVLHDRLAKRQANAAAALLTLGEPEAVWPLLRPQPLPDRGFDPSVRSYLLARLAAIGADPVGLIRRLGEEQDPAARRALLLALGDYPPESVPPGEREALVARLLVSYREDPDPGVHSAIDWLLRRRWGRAAAVDRIDRELQREAQEQVVNARAGLGRAAVATNRDWFVNTQGQVYAVICGPVTFRMGCPPTEPDLVPNNVPTAHLRRINRTFAIATREVTVEEFRRLVPPNPEEYRPIERRYPVGDAPASLAWYDAAFYCNRLSELEGIPRDQWCYEPNAHDYFVAGMRAKPGYLSLQGYRLPTEAEWEYAARARSSVARHFGRGDELLPRYAWFRKNADDRIWPVAQLRPNDFGLFDTLGNALEWTGDPNVPYALLPNFNPFGVTQDVEHPDFLVVTAYDNYGGARMTRGGAYTFGGIALRSGERRSIQPQNKADANGFRPVRTLAVHE
jgi:formylglycine-generating enzyme required for sulfatase activity